MLKVSEPREIKVVTISQKKQWLRTLRVLGEPHQRLIRVGVLHVAFDDYFYELLHCCLIICADLEVVGCPEEVNLCRQESYS